MSNHKMTITAIIAVIAIAATAAATIGVVHAQVTSDAPGSTGNEVEISVDSMNQITTQIVSTLVDKAIEPEVKMENIEQAKHLIFGKPVILQTNNAEGPESQDGGVPQARPHHVAHRHLETNRVAEVPDGGVSEPAAVAQHQRVAIAVVL